MLLATNYLVCGWFTDKIWPAVVLNLFFYLCPVLNLVSGHDLQLPRHRRLAPCCCWTWVHGRDGTKAGQWATTFIKRCFFFILFPWQETINGTLQYVSNSTLKPVEVRIGVNIEKQKLTLRFSPLRASSRLSTLLLSLPFSPRWVSHDHSYQCPHVVLGRGESGSLLHGVRGVPHKWRSCRGSWT